MIIKYQSLIGTKFWTQREVYREDVYSLAGQSRDCDSEKHVSMRFREGCWRWGELLKKNRWNSPLTFKWLLGSNFWISDICQENNVVLLGCERYNYGKILLGYNQNSMKMIDQRRNLMFNILSEFHDEISVWKHSPSLLRILKHERVSNAST